MLEHTPLTTSNFKGIWARSDNSKVPYDHLIDGLNLKYRSGELLSREGSELNITLSGVKRQYVYNIPDQAARKLVLGADGKLYDTTISTVTPILTIASMTDFSAVTINGICFITPHNSSKGIAGESVYVYNGTGTARVAAGTAPTNAPTAANSASAGNIEPGQRLFAIAYLTASGYITGISPAVLYNGPGLLKATIANIQVGGSAVVGRYILSTKILITYNGNPRDQEFFFAPDGFINDNSTTSKDVSFFDGELVESADYLFEQKATIPAGVGIGVYNNRMMVWGSDANSSLCYVSKSGEPESINNVEGFLEVLTGVGGIKNGYQIRNVWYMSKDYRTTAYVDNDDEAITWKPESADLSVGSVCHGIGQLLSEDGKNFLDTAIVVSPSGVFAFDGTFFKTEISWKIEKIWKRVNKAYLHTVEICINPFDKEICITVPLDAATAPSHVLYCDYSEGLDFENVKWCVWSFPRVPTTISFQVDFTLKTAVFLYGSSVGNIYAFDPNAHNDFSNAINNYARFGYVGSGYSSQLCHFGEMSVSMRGNGNVTPTVYGLNDNWNKVQGIIAIEAIPLGFYNRLIDCIDSEKISVKLAMNAVDNYMIINEFTLFSRVSLERRPQ